VLVLGLVYPPVQLALRLVEVQLHPLLVLLSERYARLGILGQLLQPGLSHYQ
jgi:hypothetical protein